MSQARNSQNYKNDTRNDRSHPSRWGGHERSRHGRPARGR